MSLAGFTPVSGLVANDRRTPEWDAQYRRAVEIAYRQLQLMVGAGYGVSWIDNFNLTNELRTPPPPDPSRPAPLPQLLPEEVVLQPGEHPFPTNMRCGPSRASSRTSTSTHWSVIFGSGAAQDRGPQVRHAEISRPCRTDRDQLHGRREGI
jgi:hypothetical protein